MSPAGGSLVVAITSEQTIGHVFKALLAAFEPFLYVSQSVGKIDVACSIYGHIFERVNSSNLPAFSM
jgi:hypothetical protein